MVWQTPQQSVSSPSQNTQVNSVLIPNKVQFDFETLSAGLPQNVGTFDGVHASAVSAVAPTFETAGVPNGGTAVSLATGAQFELSDITEMPLDRSRSWRLGFSVLVEDGGASPKSVYVIHQSNDGIAYNSNGHRVISVAQNGAFSPDLTVNFEIWGGGGYYTTVPGGVGSWVEIILDVNMPDAELVVIADGSVMGRHTGFTNRARNASDKNHLGTGQLWVGQDAMFTNFRYMEY